jgi:hypothetical protein
MDKSRRRRREVPWPRWRVPGTGRVPGGSASRTDGPGCPLSPSRASRLGAGDSGVAIVVLPRLLAPGYEADLFAWAPPACAYRGQDCLVAEKALDSCQAPFDLPTRFCYTTFEVQLPSVVGHCIADREPQHGDTGSRGCDHRPLQPSLELPPDPVHHGSGCERAVTSPVTLQ